MADLPQLTRKDHIILADLRKGSAMAFNSNVTDFFISEMHDYVKDARCWRISIMGETRGGKSEVGQTVALSYVEIFNHYFKLGHFDKQDVFSDKIFVPSEIQIDVGHIMSSQGNYIYTLRDNYRAGTIKFGQIWIVDEARKSIGGIGSFSEMLDLKNVNNIVAKFMQAEIWIQPLQFETNNAPYGLYVYKKDVVNKINWCLLYKMQRNAVGGVEYSFMGWVKVPLHTNLALREDYNHKKNLWIMAEMNGNVDERMIERKEMALKLSKDKEFCIRSANGKIFKLGKAQQMGILEDWIIARKSQNWNQIERQMIIEEARRLAEMRYVDECEAKEEAEDIGKRPDSDEPGL